MARKKGEQRVVFRGEDKKYRKDLKGLARATNAAFATIKRTLGGLGIAVASVFSVGRINQFIRGAISAGDKVGKAAAKVGATTKALQAFRFAAQQTGTGVKAADVALQRFSRRVGSALEGSGELAKRFTEDELAAIRSAEGTDRLAVALDIYAEKVANTKGEQEQLLLTFNAFDTEGASLVNLLKGGKNAIAEYAREADKAGIILDKALVKRAEKLNDILSKSNDQVAAAANTFGLRLAPAWVKSRVALNDLLITLIKFIETAGPFLIFIAKWTAAIAALRLAKVAWAAASRLLSTALQMVALQSYAGGHAFTFLAIKARIARIAIVGLKGAMTFGLGAILAFLPEIIGFFQRWGVSLKALEIVWLNLKSIALSTLGSISKWFGGDELASWAERNVAEAKGRLAELEQERKDAEARELEDKKTLEEKKAEIEKKAALKKKVGEERKFAQAELAFQTKEYKRSLKERLKSQIDFERESWDLRKKRKEAARIADEEEKADTIAALNEREELFLERKREWNARKEEFDDQAAALGLAKDSERYLAWVEQKIAQEIEEDERKANKKANDDLLDDDARRKGLEKDREFWDIGTRLREAEAAGRTNNAKVMFSELASIETHGSKELKKIKKAAALGDIAIATVDNAFKVYAHTFALFSKFTPAPIAKGIAIAAAALVSLAGGIAKAQVAGFYEGGIVPGTPAGYDNRIIMASAGEAVVPRDRVGETFDAIANRRAQEIEGDVETPQPIHIENVITLDGEEIGRSASEFMFDRRIL